MKSKGDSVAALLLGATLHRARRPCLQPPEQSPLEASCPQPGQTKPPQPGRHFRASGLGTPRSYPGLIQSDAGATASPGLGGGAAGGAGLGGAGPRGDEMAAASGRPRLCSGPRPRPGTRRLGPEKAERALPGVHHGPARGTESTPRPGKPSKAGPPAGQSGPAKPSRAVRDEPVRSVQSADEHKREPGRGREVGVSKRRAGSGGGAAGGSTDTPPASPSSAGAERSRHFYPFLSRSRSRAPCVRAPAPQGQRNRFRPQPRRGAARPASPSRQLSPLPAASSCPAPGAASALGGRGATLWAVSSMVSRSPVPQG